MFIIFLLSIRLFCWILGYADIIRRHSDRLQHLTQYQWTLQLTPTPINYSFYVFNTSDSDRHIPAVVPTGISHVLKSSQKLNIDITEQSLDNGGKNKITMRRGVELAIPREEKPYFPNIHLKSSSSGCKNKLFTVRPSTLPCYGLDVPQENKWGW